MITYYCTKGPKCTTKTLDTARVNMPVCCNAPMTTDKNAAACCNNANTTANQNKDAGTKKDCCCS